MQSAENLRKECHRFWLRSTSYSDSDFERSNISFKENKPDGVDPNSNGFDYCFRKEEGRALRFSADCISNGAEISDMSTALDKLCSTCRQTSGACKEGNLENGKIIDDVKLEIIRED